MEGPARFERMSTENGKLLRRAKTAAILKPRSAQRKVTDFQLRRRATEGNMTYLSRLQMGAASLLTICMGCAKIVNWAWNVVSFSCLPSWLRDGNEFLQGDHRPPMYSFVGCAKSMFRLHTETWNIWTHFLGFLFWLALSVRACVIGGDASFLFKGIQVHNLPWVEQALLLLFYVSEMAVFSFSFSFHLFSNHSRRVYLLFSRLDYSGITFVLSGSFIPSYYYGLHCRPLALYTHVTIQCLLSVLCVCATFWFSAPRYRMLRFTLFTLLGFYAVIPTTQIIMQDGLWFARHAYCLSGILTAALFAVLGAVLYVLKIPERFFPGKITVWASSHQFWHLCCIIVGLLMYSSVLDMIKFRMNVGGCTEVLDD